MMTIYPGDRVGEHLIETVTIPMRYLLLDWRGQTVRIPMNRIRVLAKLDREVDHLGNYDFSWTEKRALETAGLAVADLRGGVWPTDTLIASLPEKDKPN